MSSLPDKILAVMNDHEWHTLAELTVKTGGKPPSVAASMRALRWKEKGGHNVERRLHDGVHQYRIPGAMPAPAPVATATPEPAVQRKPRTVRAPVVASDGLTVGQIIRGRRTQLFMTQKQLAEQVGVKPLAVNHWEMRNYFPRNGKLAKVAEVLGLSEQQILSGKRNERKKTGPKPKPKAPSIDLNALAAAIAEVLLKTQGK
jgi:transcriptional regulator with XRE-family HTH domain